MGRRKRVSSEWDLVRPQQVKRYQEWLAAGIMCCKHCSRDLNESNGRVVVTGEGRIYTACKPMCPNLSLVDTADLQIPTQRLPHG